MKTAPILGVICLTGLLAALPAAAKDKHGRGHQTEIETSVNDSAKGKPGDQRAFTEPERQVICRYVERFGKQEGKHPRALPPGLAKKVARGGKLPPGWERKCVQGERMPVEVYQECRPLPPELVVKLPVPPVGTVTVAVGGKIVRLLEATREILDVLDVQVRL